MVSGVTCLPLYAPAALPRGVIRIEEVEQVPSRREGEGRALVGPILDGQERVFPLRTGLHVGERRIFANGACRVHRPEARLQHFHRDIVQPLAYRPCVMPEFRDERAIFRPETVEPPRRRDRRDRPGGDCDDGSQRKAAPKAIAHEDGRARQRGKEGKQPFRHMPVETEGGILHAGCAPVDEIGVMSCRSHVAQHGTFVPTGRGRRAG